MKGTIEHISYTNYGIKFQEEANWINAKTQSVKDVLTTLKNGDVVEYEKNKRVLTSLGTANTPAPIPASQLKPNVLDDMMSDSMKVVANGMSGFEKDARENSNWASCVNTLFMAKTGKLPK